MTPISSSVQRYTGHNNMGRPQILLQLQAEFPELGGHGSRQADAARIHAAMGNLDLALPILTGLRNIQR